MTNETLRLLDAWVSLLAERRGVKSARSDVIALALKNLRPPEGQSPSEANVRRAYKTLFD